jgi:hypothetical protein
MSPQGEFENPNKTAGQSTDPAAAQALQNQKYQTDFCSVPPLWRPARTALSPLYNLKGTA